MVDKYDEDLYENPNITITEKMLKVNAAIWLKYC
jgi:hypothetical protein